MVKDGQVYQFLVADSSGSIVLSLWNDNGKSLQPGDIIRIIGTRLLISRWIRYFIQEFLATLFQQVWKDPKNSKYHLV